MLTRDLGAHRKSYTLSLRIDERIQDNEKVGTNESACQVSIILRKEERENGLESNIYHCHEIRDLVDGWIKISLSSAQR
jgi:hypothetical protein